MAVEVLACPVIARSRPRVCVAGGDLHVPHVHACVEHGRDERVPEHMGMSPGYVDSRCLGQAPEPPGGCMPVHPRAAAVEQDRPGVTQARVTVAGSDVLAVGGDGRCRVSRSSEGSPDWGACRVGIE